MHSVKYFGLLDMRAEIFSIYPNRERAPRLPFFKRGTIIFTMRITQESKSEGEDSGVTRLHLPAAKNHDSHQLSLIFRLLTRSSASHALRIFAGTFLHSTGNPCQLPSGLHVA